MATMSYVSGASDVPLIGDTIGQQLEQTAARFPDRLALVVRQQRVRLTWRELDAEVDKLAAGLLALGLAPGDRVGIWSPNNVEWVLTQLATARAGMVLVCINPAYRLHELDYALNKAGCRRARHRDRLQDQRLCRHAAGAAAGAAALPAGPARRRRACRRCAASSRSARSPCPAASPSPT